MTKRKPLSTKEVPETIDMRNPEANYIGDRTLVTIRQLEGKLNLNARTITRYIEQGIFPPAIRFGRRCVRYDLDSTMAAAKAYQDDCVAESEI